MIRIDFVNFKTLVPGLFMVKGKGIMLQLFSKNFTGSPLKPESTSSCCARFLNACMILHQRICPSWFPSEGMMTLLWIFPELDPNMGTGLSLVLVLDSGMLFPLKSDCWASLTHSSQNLNTFYLARLHSLSKKFICIGLNWISAISALLSARQNGHVYPCGCRAI